MLKDGTEKKSYLEIFQQVIEAANPTNNKHLLLLVDDEPNNLALLRRTLRSKYDIITATNGIEALEVVKEKGDDISLIISDQKMPQMQGTEFLTQVTETHPHIIKLLLTGHSDLDILIDSINKCNLFQYIFKPFEPEELMIIVQNGIETLELEQNKERMLKELKDLFYTTIKSISSALDAKDTYTHGHSLRVTMYSLILAKYMDNVDDKFKEELETAGLLHDIGKIGIADCILCKTGKLSDEVFEIIKSHPEKCKKLLNNIKKLDCVSEWLNSHHEKWDGTGYPKGLKGEEIPISARIIAIADTYDAMTSSRSYRQSLPHETARDEIISCRGTQFDPTLVDIFIKAEHEFAIAHDNPEEYYHNISILRQHIGTDEKELSKKVW
ncbi:MAG: HD domain-containing protein [Candidatus Gastranaerophilales bacterium]|nr:HD domain-containing protein [Candidatus Gastranaerophilales bacterium]